MFSDFRNLCMKQTCTDYCMYKKLEDYLNDGVKGSVY